MSKLPLASVEVELCGEEAYRVESRRVEIGGANPLFLLSIDMARFRLSAEATESDRNRV